MLRRPIRVGKPADYVPPDAQLIQAAMGSGLLGTPGDEGVGEFAPGGPDLSKVYFFFVDTMCVCVCGWVCVGVLFTVVCVHVSVCVCERERERESVCVCRICSNNIRTSRCKIYVNRYLVCPRSDTWIHY